MIFFVRTRYAVLVLSVPTSSPSDIPTAVPTPSPSISPTNSIRTLLIIPAVTSFTGVTIDAFNSSIGREIFSVAATLDQMSVYPSDVSIIGFIDNTSSSNGFNSAERRSLEELSFINVYWRVEFVFEERGFDNETIAYESYVTIFNSNLNDDDFIAQIRFSNPIFRSTGHLHTQFDEISLLDVSPRFPSFAPTYSPVQSPSSEDDDPNTFLPVITVFIILMVMLCCLAMYCIHKNYGSEKEKNSHVRDYEAAEDDRLRSVTPAQAVFPTQSAPQNLKNKTSKIHKKGGRILPSKYKAIAPNLSETRVQSADCDQSPPTDTCYIDVHPDTDIQNTIPSQIEKAGHIVEPSINSKAVDLLEKQPDHLEAQCLT